MITRFQSDDITNEDDYYEGIWEDYDSDEYSDKNITVPSKRIDFKKFSTTYDKSINEVKENLPRSIYCDIVNTLNSKCAMVNLLEIWR